MFGDEVGVDCVEVVVVIIPDDDAGDRGQCGGGGYPGPDKD